MIKGKTLKEANELLKESIYFVADYKQKMTFQNVVQVELENDKIIKFKGIGSWIQNESKN